MNSRLALLLASVACIAAVALDTHSQDETTVVARRLMLKEPLPLARTELGDGVIFPLGFGDSLLQQCSRTTLGKGDSYWVPTTANVEETERILADYQKNNKPTGNPAPAAWPDLRKYHRQYIGVFRDGKQTIYASYFPAQGIGEEDWRLRPLQLCDGGPAYFGVETDLQAEAVIHIAFDGCLCKVTEQAER